MAASAGLAFAQPEGRTTVFSFGTSPEIGASPQARLIFGPGNRLYGTTQEGGRYGKGTVFSLQADGTGYATLHHFGDRPFDGASPEAGLVLLRDGRLCGTANAGGNFNRGVLYVLNADGSGYSVLRHFGDGTFDGEEPTAAPVQGADGVLYGTTRLGGGAPMVLGKFGTVYRIGSDGSGYTVLHRFLENEGWYPKSGLIFGRDGRLYGTTLQSGTIRINGVTHYPGMGSIYTLNPDGSGFATLYAFQGFSDTALPQRSLVQVEDGRLFGTASMSRSGTGGVVFSLRPDGSNFTLQHTFNPAEDGYGPVCELILARDGRLYGTTTSGGAAYRFRGKVFSVRPDGGGFLVNHHFGSLEADGDGSVCGLVQGGDGRLFGVSRAGGTANRGAVFALPTSPPAITSSSTISALIGAPLRHQITVENYAAAFAVTGSVPGLTFDRTNGVLSGTPVQKGTYTLTITAGNLLGTARQVLTLNFQNPSRLANLSVRSVAGAGDRTLIVGISATGSGPKRLLLRAVGPTLAGFGVSGALADPSLRIFNSAGNQLAENDDWGGAPALETAARDAGAFALPRDSRDAALSTSLQSGSHTASVAGSTATEGIVLLEAYDIDVGLPATRLVNLSARSEVGTGGNLLVAGFAIVGDVPKRILVRAIGPTLAAFGVNGALSDPRLRLFEGANLRAENDNWGGSSALSDAFRQTGAFALAANTGDAAIIATLSPGTYTAQIVGNGDTTGVALVEIYEVP